MFPRRFSLRSLLIATTIAAMLIGGWVGAQLSWIRERRTLRAEGLETLEAAGNYACGATMTEVPPSGPTLMQRQLQIFGEAPVDKVYVFYIVSNRDYTVRDGYEYWFKVTDYPRIRRARELFPEATIEAVFVQREHVDAGHFKRFASMISE